MGWVWVDVGCVWEDLELHVVECGCVSGSGCMWLSVGGSGCMWSSVSGNGWMWLSVGGSGWV